MSVLLVKVNIFSRNENRIWEKQKWKQKRTCLLANWKTNR